MFEEIRGEVRRSAHSFLHDRTDNPLRLPLEVNVVLVGFDGEGGFRHTVDERALADFLRDSFGRYRPSCLETGEQLEVEVELRYNVLHAAETRSLDWNRGRLGDDPGRRRTPPREWNDAGSNPAGGFQPANVGARTRGGVRRGRARRSRRLRKLFAPAEPVAVFVVNPDKRRMDSLDPAPPPPPRGRARRDMSPRSSSARRAGTCTVTDTWGVRGEPRRG